MKTEVMRSLGVRLRWLSTRIFPDVGIRLVGASGQPQGWYWGTTVGAGHLGPDSGLHSPEADTVTRGNDEQSNEG